MCEGGSDDSGAEGADESNAYGTDPGSGYGGYGSSVGTGDVGSANDSDIGAAISAADVAAEVAAQSQAQEDAFGGMHTNAQALGDPSGVSAGHMSISNAIKGLFSPITDINTPLGNIGPSYADLGLLGLNALTGVGVPGLGMGLSAAVEHGIDETADSAVAGQEADAAAAGAGDAGQYDGGLMAGYSPGRQTAINSLMSNTSPSNFRSGYNPQPRPQWGGLMHPQLELGGPVNTNPWSAPQEWQWRR